MDIAPIQRTAVSDVVFARLVDEILSGRLAPGDPLPSERELAESFEVNRHAVREALKRVQQVGLVRISQGGKTRVLDWRENAGLDLLSALAGTGAFPARKLVTDILEMRRAVAADAVALCTRLADEPRRGRIVHAAAAYPIGPVSLATLVAIDLAFWQEVIAGSGNVAYQLALNTLVAGLADIGLDELGELATGEYADRDAHIELAAAIGRGDEDGARALTWSLLGRILPTPIGD